MAEEGLAALRRRAVLGGVTGFTLALVISSGILVQRVLGLTTANAVMANVATTVAAVAAVLMTVRIFLASFESSSVPADCGKNHDARVTCLLSGQAVGALFGVLAIHLLASRDLASHPWLREHPRQLVNDLVAVFGILAFVWASAQKPIRSGLMIGGLALVLGYEITAGYWHLDGPVPVAHVLPWSIQRFVGSEVTASGLGVLAFRLLLA